MSEIAIVSSRRARLLRMAESGSAGAREALALSAEPTRFLSSVQVGITSIGILNGAIGDGAIANRIQISLERVPVFATYAESIAIVVMVIALTYVSLILGELVPKRIALVHPEAMAAAIARPMAVLASIGRPIVYLLSVSTDTILRVFGIRGVQQPAVTVEEIKVLLEQGAEEGSVEPTEHELVTNVLNLDDRHVGAVLTPRSDIVFLDVRAPLEENRRRLREDPYAVLPLCDGGLDTVLGFVRSTEVWEQLVEAQRLDLPSLAEPALFVPETMTLMKLLEQFKRTHLPVALVVDEFGEVEGLVSWSDVTASIVGDLPAEPGEEPTIVRREDGSWLFDGSLDIESVIRTLDVGGLLDDDDRQHYHTLGGFMMLGLGRVPRTGDVFEKGGYRFEIVDMDGNRVDRVLVCPQSLASRDVNAPRPHNGSAAGPHDG
jgi:putative hemolysin